MIEDEPGIVDFLERGLRTHGFEVDVGRSTALAGSQRAVSEHVRSGRARHDAPRGAAGSRCSPTCGRRKPATAGDHPHRARRGRGPDRRTRRRRDRLPDQAVLARELAARIRAQLRVVAQTPTTILTGGRRRGRSDHARGPPRRGPRAPLDDRVRAALVSAAQQRPRPLARADPAGAVWGYDYDPGTNVVDVYVGYLRRKLRRRGDKDPIVTVRSVGYRFDAPV